MTRSQLTVLLFLALAAGCGDDSGGDGSVPLPDGGNCGPGACNGCCQGSQCLSGNDNSACGAVGLPCVQCQQNEVCIQGQCRQYSGKCNPSNCATGCCDGDSCLPGTTKEACGSGGIPCIACAASQTCDNQSCGCGPGTCNGCCEAGVCRSGTDPAACGSGGVTCKSCPTGDSCILGVCSSSSGCSAASCSGCCSGATCKTGDVDTDCGQGGQTCKACKTGESCQQGVCINSQQCSPTSCTGCCDGTQCLSGLSATACGSGGAPCKVCSSKELCQSGACALDPSALWGVVISDATIDSSKSWDTLVYTAPDPYVKVTVGAQSGTTSVINDTYTPSWDEYLFSASASDIVQGGMSVEVYDDDWPTSDQLMGACSITVPESVLISGSGVVNGCGSSGDVQDLSFQFTL